VDAWSKDIASASVPSYWPRRTFCTSSSRPWRTGRSPPARSALAAPLTGRRARAAQPTDQQRRPKIKRTKKRHVGEGVLVVAKRCKTTPTASTPLRASTPTPAQLFEADVTTRSKGAGAGVEVPGLTRPARSTVRPGRRGRGRSDQGRQHDRRHSLPVGNDRRRPRLP